MKRRLFLLLFLLLIFRYGIGQQYIRLSDGSIVTDKHRTTKPTRTVEDVKEGILVTYEFNYVSKNQDDLFPSSAVMCFDGFGIGEVPEKPALPIKWDTFYVPSEKDYSIDIIDSSFVEFPIEIAPARQPMENGSHTIYTTDNVLPIKPYEGIYPQNTINTKINKYRTYPILDISINPIRYNYQQKRVVICKKISYLINIEKGDKNKYVIKKSELATDPLLANIIMNPWAKEKKEKLRQPSTATQISTPKYLIISVPKFSAAVSKLADWKRTLGYNVEIVTQTTWDEYSIKNAIIASNQVSPISYLLLFGDYDDVPGKYISKAIEIPSKGFIVRRFYTDYYYGCINQNTYPDIRRGRISASSLSEANTIVDKIINYERYPITSPSFYNNGIHCAYFQDDDYYDNNSILIQARDSVEDRRFTLNSEEIRDHMLQQGDTISRIYYAETSVTPKYWKTGDYGMASNTPIPVELLKSNGFPWNGNYQDIINRINNGAFYVLLRDHGKATEWSQPNFTTEHIEQLNNSNKLPIVFSICCLTGKFDQGICFAEAFLRKSGGGCAGIFAATANGFSGFNDALSLAMFEAIWPNPSFIKPFPSSSTPVSITTTPVYKLGDLLDQGLAAIPLIYPGGYSDVMLYTKEIFHCFGDPTMEMYTGLPTPFANVSITKNNGYIIVSVGEDATITFFNRTTGAIESFYGSDITYPDDNNLQVCISAHNKIPYIKEAGWLYIQNESISNTTTYHADHIKVGSNVTSIKPTGPVIISSGKTTLIGDTVQLEGETTIDLGAELEIKN